LKRMEIKQKILLFSIYITNSIILNIFNIILIKFNKLERKIEKLFEGK